MLPVDIGFAFISTCVFTDKWSLDELAYGVPTDGPYQTNPPSPDDIILSIQIDREGQVRRICHEEEIDVHKYQILTHEIVPTLKPLKEIILENVMAAPIISISSDSSDESVGYHAPRVILFGTIPAIIPVIPEVPIAPADPIVEPVVGEVSVISPIEVLDLVDYSSSSDSDPSEDSLPIVPSSEFPLALVVAPTRDSSTAIDSCPTRIAWRRVPHRSSDCHSSLDFTLDLSSSSSSSDSSSDISSGSSLDSLSDSSSVHSEAFMHWRSASLSTFYPPTTSESSPDSSSERSLDSSSPSAGPSRKRCRSLTTLVPLSTPVSRSIAPALVDLPPHKRFRDSYPSEVSGEEHMEMGTADAETIADLGISEGVGAQIEDGIDLGVEVATSDIREDEEEIEAEASEGGTMEIAVDPLAAGDIFEPTGGDAHDLEGTLYDISHYMSEVPLDRITEFETAQRYLRCHMALSQEEFHQVRRDRVDTRRRLRRTMTITHSGMTPEAIEELVNRRVEEALARQPVLPMLSRLKVKAKTIVTAIMEMVEMEMVEMEIQMRMIEGTEGVVGLIRWFEKMETVFYISSCLEKYQVKYGTCTLLNSALTWWNSHKRTVGTDAAFAMSWRELMKLMAEVYCPRNEIQKIESELWNLTMKNNDLAAYT
ncbi:putative reverse transcriptase domain-containing protein [Tanacetum coccineum]